MTPRLRGRGPVPARQAGLAALAGLTALAALSALWLSFPGTAVANGGTLRLASVPMGEYRVSVFTDPTPVRPDSLDVSVLILQEGVLGVPDGVRVTVRARLVEAHGEHAGEHGAAPLPREQVLEATREQADDPRYYAAKFALGAEGRWEITVAVDGPDGAGEASFELRARERGLLGHPLVLITLALLPLAGAAWWVLREERSA